MDDPGGEQDAAASPYGLVGLGLSLAAILVMAAIFCGVAAGLAVLAVAARFGWADVVARYDAVTAPGGGDDLKAAAFALSILAYLALSLAVLIMARWRGGARWRDLIALRPWSLRQSGRAYWIIAGAALAYSLAASVALSYLYPPSDSWVKMPQQPGPALMLVVLAVLMAPVTEELIFRGWIYTSLRVRMRPRWALIITSAVFAFLHYEDSHLYALVVFPIGLALGVIRERSGSIKASMTFHALYNGVVCCLAYFDIG